MPAPSSQTLLINQALALLGTSKTITSINDPTPTAKTARNFWETTRDEVMTDHPWNFAIRRGSLPLSADYTPSNEYDFAFELPENALRWLPWQEDHSDYFLGEQEGRFLLTNAEAPLFARWIERIEDTARWSAGFKSALIAKLAFYLAEPVTAKASMADRMDGLYRKALSDAKRQDGAATGRVQRGAAFRSNWLAARNRRFVGRP